MSSGDIASLGEDFGVVFRRDPGRGMRGATAVAKPPRNKVFMGYIPVHFV